MVKVQGQVFKKFKKYIGKNVGKYIQDFPKSLICFDLILTYVLIYYIPCLTFFALKYKLGPKGCKLQHQINRELCQLLFYSSEMYMSRATNKCNGVYEVHMCTKYNRQQRRICTLSIQLYPYVTSVNLVFVSDKIIKIVIILE